MLYVPKSDSTWKIEEGIAREKIEREASSNIIKKKAQFKEYLDLDDHMPTSKF